jgi:hypothetical protein
VTTTLVGVSLLPLVWILRGTLVIAAAARHLERHLRASSTQFPTLYQAVLLSSGSVYFGHLQGYGGTQPVMTEVYYVVT